MDVEAFIARWTAREGGAERANYQGFLIELCDVLGVPRPDPAGAQRELNDYVFERAVRPRESDALSAPKRIDLYKKDAFILEAKQSRLPGKKNAIPGQLSMLADEPNELGRRGVARGWDVMMQNARKQAEGYVFLLDANHPSPPFLITCDVGHCFEIYADFTGTGRAYSQFPDRQHFRIFMEDLRDENVRKRLAQIWTDPHGLDPTKHAAKVTRDIAKRLAEVSKALEARKCNPEDVAHFLMRCLFTMFAEDVDLLPKDSFTKLLEKSVADPTLFAHRLKTLWKDMDRGELYSGVIDARVRQFNGGLFQDTTVFELGREEIGELLEAARKKWTEVDPAIFGTLLEQALSPSERKKLGAHYTPRAYVQRLVDVTVMEPLRADWQAALTKAEQAKEDGDEKRAIEIVRAFHHQLCSTRVLDPACGTGNFLYVSLELMKKLEGEVLETLAKLGQSESLGLERETVDPHQFLGLELNPRAAAIAELVVWIGYLQQHYKTRSGHPSEPILKAFANINFGMRHGYDAVLSWDGYPDLKVLRQDGKSVETYPNPRRPVWPEAEFIVGNPPFLGKGAAMRGALGDSYVEALWSAHKWIDQSADFVMYWWDRAAELLANPNPSLRQFGLVTTNSISGVFNRRTVERHLKAKQRISIVYAVPDHPWTKAASDSASVRIAMTACRSGNLDGLLNVVTAESAVESDEPKITLQAQAGYIHSDLTVGADVGAARPLIGNEGMSCNGMMLAGQGFVLTGTERQHFAEQDPSSASLIKPFLNGGELVRRPRTRFVIDALGWEADELRAKHPHLYQYLLARVKPERDENRRDAFRKRWWVFGEPRKTFRPALEELRRYIGTTETSKHRIFQFIPARTIPDHMIIAIASDHASLLAVLSSAHHVLWATRAGGWLGVGNDPRYSKSRCFDPFPFPVLHGALESRLSAAGEELDATRKRLLAEHADLTLTGVYNVLEKIRSGIPLSDNDEDVKSRGLVLILKELHEKIDHLTAEAYGWPADLSDDQVVERLVGLNAERAKEEAGGIVRWLRPEYQISRFGQGAAAKTGELDLGEKVVAIDKSLPSFPTDRYEQPLAIEAILLSSSRAMNAAEIARAFKRGGKRIEKRVEQVLTTLARYGRVNATEDQRYVARRAA